MDSARPTATTTTASAHYLLALPGPAPALPATITPPPKPSTQGGTLREVATATRSYIANAATEPAVAVDRALMVAHQRVGDPKSEGYGRYVIGGTGVFALAGGAYGALALGSAADALAYGGLAAIAATIAVPLSVVALDVFAQIRQRRRMLQRLATASVAVQALLKVSPNASGDEVYSALKTALDVVGSGEQTLKLKAHESMHGRSQSA